MNVCASKKQRSADDAAFLWSMIEGNPNILLTRAQAAIVLNVSERWLEMGAHKGYGPNMSRAGRMVRYRGFALVDYAKQMDDGEAV